MKTGHGRVVLDPFDFLPGYGENDVRVSTHGLQLEVVIEYDGPDHLPAMKTLVFEGPVSFTKQSFPGVNMRNIVSEKANRPMLDGLIEYPDSELAAAWQKHFSGLLEIKHFGLAPVSWTP
jgi:hypothetical protein